MNRAPRGNRRQQAMQGRLAEVPVGGAMRAGALVGLVNGLVLGAVLGAAAAWLAGSLAGWEGELTSTYGIGGNLLPFGGSGGILLAAVTERWYLVVAGASLAAGLVLAVFGALLAGLLAATYNRWRPATVVVVEVPQHEDAGEPEEAAAATAPTVSERSTPGQSGPGAA
ncbi:MAG: hypothetical protein ACP5VP_01115 [Candidatus Limnocylindrales bacterium]